MIKIPNKREVQKKLLQSIDLNIHHYTVSQKNKLTLQKLNEAQEIKTKEMKQKMLMNQEQKRC